MRRELPVYVPDDFYIGGISLTATIDSSLIDTTLTEFPVGIDLSSTSFISGKSATGWQYLHVLSGTSECQVEVDVWDMVTPQAIIWVKVPIISSVVDTDLLISFGADNTTTYVGQTGDAAAQAVWNSNFAAVYHMSQDPSGGAGAILDSTSNANNGTSAGTMLTEDLVDIGFGKAIDFDGTDDYINCGSDSSLDDIAVKTLEVYGYFDGYGEGSSGRIMQKANVNADGWQLLLQGDPGYRLYFGQDWNNGTFCDWGSPVSSLSLPDQYYLVLQYDKQLTTNTPVMFIDGVSQTVSAIGSSPAGTCDSDAANSMWIGARNNSGADRTMDAKLSEVRISNTARSAAWIKATNAVLAKTLVTLS